MISFISWGKICSMGRRYSKVINIAIRCGCFLELFVGQMAEVMISSGNEHGDQIWRQLRMRDCHLLVHNSTGGPRVVGHCHTGSTCRTTTWNTVTLPWGTTQCFNHSEFNIGTGDLRVVRAVSHYSGVLLLLIVPEHVQFGVRCRMAWGWQGRVKKRGKSGIRG